MQLVDEVFAPDGALATAWPTYRPRSAQHAMAQAVATTLQDGGMLAVEAGTGVGKTYAYLVPLLLARTPALISTATKTLQDQLFLRDIPALRALLGAPVKVAVLKGRSSYVCLHRLEQARQAHALSDAQMAGLAAIEHWALATTSGDLSEVEGMDEGHPLVAAVTSTRDNCLGAKCPQWDACHVYAARRRAMVADLVVVNHHLFFADLQVRESGVAELLPTVRAVVFDEAHQLNDVGVQFLGQQWSSGQLLSLAQDMLRCGRELARGFADWEGHAHALEASSQALRHALGARLGHGRVDGGVLEVALEAAPVAQALADVLQALQHAQQALASVDDVSPEFGLLQARSAAQAQQLSQMRQPVPPGMVRWAELSAHWRIVQAPLDIAQAMKERVLQAQPGRAWIFTSATLGHEPTLSWFINTCGIDGATPLQLPSPFDYPQQAGLYVPQEFPSVGDERHSAAVAKLAWEGAVRLGGRTMVLTTTLRALRHIGHVLVQQAQASGQTLEVLVQGQAPKRALLERFCGERRAGQPGCVLVASASFWEGIDIPGDALQLLIIDKLPFSPPDDPVLQARAQWMESLGRSAFKELHLPLAAVALKQGAGRLIRRESDRGVLVVCDSRLTRMGYGRKLVQALPPMRRLETQSDFFQALDDLVKPPAQPG